eukprot:4504702-Pleurochrysis_carterae.AAC.1
MVHYLAEAWALRNSWDCGMHTVLLSRRFASQYSTRICNRETPLAGLYFMNGEKISNSETLKAPIALEYAKAHPQMQRDAATLLNLPANVASPMLQLSRSYLFSNIVD